MKKESLYRIGTNVEITARGIDGKILDVTNIHNAIMNVGFNMLRDIFMGDVADGEIKYVALGSDDTAVAVAQTILITEEERKALTTSPVSGGVGSCISTVYFGPAEAVGFTIKEVGWFSGAAAGAGADSGIMISRVLYTRTKTVLESLQVKRTDTFSEVT